jgi:glucose-6-phosphate isomerase
MAIGATDQHSQVQLYNEGPKDKYVLFVVANQFREDPTIPTLFSGHPSCDYVQGKKLSTVLQALKQGTEEALTTNGRPNATISLPEINARTMGALLYTLEMATAMAGTLYGVNPFDQPGVEAGKRAAFSQLGRSGYPPPSLPPENEGYIVR